MREIPLTQGKVALVDDEDYETLARFRWRACRNGNVYYAQRRGNKAIGEPTVVYIHREILNAPNGSLVDHRDGDGLNNIRPNLRLVTRSQNLQNSRRSKRNTSGHKGVSWNKARGKWSANIGHDSELIHLGLYSTREEAYAAYCEASAKFHGAFGRTA